MGKKKGKKEKAYIVDNVDTTSLSLKQLQTFCEKVHEEMRKTEMESRNLELERNKLKTMVELSMQELVRVKANRREKEFDLGQTLEANTTKAMEQQILLRNVRSEKHRAVMGVMLVSDNNMQLLQRNSAEIRGNIEKDLKKLRDEIVQQDNDRNSKTIMLQKELEIKKSGLLNTSDNDSKLQTAGYEKKMSELSSKLKKKNLQEYETFNEYKNRKIQEFLTDNDKLNVSLRHYYEKLCQRNMNVLNGMHEEYKSVKDDVKQLQSTLKFHKDVVEKTNLAIKANNEKIKEFSIELANSSDDRKRLRNIKTKLISKQKLKKNQQFDHLFLEETLRLKNKEQIIDFQKKGTITNRLKDNVMREILMYECLANKIVTQLTKINCIVESRAKLDSESSNMTGVVMLALAQLEEEAALEEKQIPKMSLSF